MDYEVTDWSIRDLEPSSKWPTILLFDHDKEKEECMISSDIPGCHQETRIAKVHIEQESCHPSTTIRSDTEFSPIVARRALDTNHASLSPSWCAVQVGVAMKVTMELGSCTWILAAGRHQCLRQIVRFFQKPAEATYHPNPASNMHPVFSVYHPLLHCLCVFDRIFSPCRRIFST